jgi:solute carrier family 25 phosphate transporter 23/24/25/41
MTSDSILYPLEVVSTRVTMNMSKKGTTSIAQAMVEIVKKEGIRGLYCGWGSAMVGVVPYAGISFGCYDILSTQYRKLAGVDSAGPLPTLGIGFISGFLASTISFPLYSATVKLQTGAAVPGLVGKKNLVSLMRYTIAKDGYKGLFNGWLPASTKMIPQAGISFVVYEMVKQRLDQSNYVDLEADEDEDLGEVLS